jgi:soluble lytic murein transglycosylase
MKPDLSSVKLQPNKNIFINKAVTCCFIFLLILCTCTSNSHPHVQLDDFYLGLLNDSNDEKIILFERALISSNEYIRQAAAEELAILLSQGYELSERTIIRIRQEIKGFWADAFDISANFNKEKVLFFLLSNELNTASFHEARRFVMLECEKHGIVFSETEQAIINGHYAFTSLRNNDALNYFRILQTNGIWPEQPPELFLIYPNLINNLGRTFQNTQTGNEGITLLLQWETNLTNRNNAQLLQDQRYRLLHSAGRIARVRGHANTIPIFERALQVTSNGEQTDIVVWNILDVSLNRPADVFNDRLEQYIPYWHRGSFYNDILERFLHRLVLAQDWDNLIRAFSLIKDNNNDFPTAAFAWIIYRTLEENLLSNDQRRLAAAAINSQTADLSAFARITYNASFRVSIPSLYYRSLSAAVLNLPFIEFSDDSETETKPSPALEFLLGFFEHGAAHLANPYIRSMERDLSPDELRSLAQAYTDEQTYHLAMRLVAQYINRESYTIKRLDLELAYPRPYLELTERHARQNDSAPSLMFALIRAESAFQSAVVSRAGAVGLAQLMPATADEMANRLRRLGIHDYFSPENTLDLTDPELNVHIGSYYLNLRRNNLNNDIFALMAYNGGINRVRRWERASTNLPPDLVGETANIFETRDYFKRVLGFAAIYEELYYREN